MSISSSSIPDISKSRSSCSSLSSSSFLSSCCWSPVVASKTTLVWLSMFKVFNNKLLAPPSSNSASVFLNKGSILSSCDNFFTLIESKDTKVSVSSFVLDALDFFFFVCCCSPSSYSAFVSSPSSSSPSSIAASLAFSASICFLAARPLSNLPVSVATESTLEE